MPALIPRGAGPANTTPAACGNQRPAPAAKSVADRCTNSSQRQTRKPTEPRRGWFLPLSFYRRLVSLGFFLQEPVVYSASAQTNSSGCTLVTPHTLRPSPRAIRDRRQDQYSKKPRLPAPCLHTMRARRVRRFCGRRRRTGQTAVPRLPRSILEMQQRNLGCMRPKWRNAYSKLRLRACTSRVRRVGLF